MLEIIDDFFEDPYKVREIGLNLLKFQHSCILNDSGNNYPGIRVQCPPEINNYIKEKIKHLLNKKILKFNSAFHITSSIHECGLIHKDGERLAGLVYLNENPPKDSGTILCDKIYENFEYTSRFNEAASTRDINFIRSFANEKKIFNKKNFTINTTVENKFNRFILYDGQQYHAPHNYFGNNLFNSRLVLVFWVNVEEL
jgi:hypothetical protein